MNIATDQTFFIFDIESLGLYGPGFAFAAGIFDTAGNEAQAAIAHVSITPKMAQGVSKEDLDWVKRNVKLSPQSRKCPTLRELRSYLWACWEDAKREHPGLMMAMAFEAHGQCGNFLRLCAKNAPSKRKHDEPLTIASIMFAAGMDPMAEYGRLDNEKPAHNPLADIRQSARLLAEAIRKLNNPPASIPPILRIVLPS